MLSQQDGAEGNRRISNTESRMMKERELMECSTVAAGERLMGKHLSFDIHYSSSCGVSGAATHTYWRFRGASRVSL